MYISVMCHSETVSRYVNPAIKTEDRQGDNLTANQWHHNRPYDNSQYHQRRKSRQLDDPLPSVRNGNEYYNDMEDQFSKHIPWASVHWLVQCTLECHWLTQCTLEYHWATQRILAGYTGTPLEKLSWNSPKLECHWRNSVESAPHWEATGETNFAAYTGTPLEGLWQPTHAPTHS